MQGDKYEMTLYSEDPNDDEYSAYVILGQTYPFTEIEITENIELHFIFEPDLTTNVGSYIVSI